MNGKNARKKMLNQLRNNILRKNKKVIAREVQRRVNARLAALSFRDRLRILFTKKLPITEVYYYDDI